MTRTRRALALTLVLLTASVGVSACTEAEPPATVQATPEHTGGPATGEHNDADVAFAKDMFPYTIQALQLTDIAAAKASTDQVKTVAAGIKEAQAAQVATIGGWISGFGEQVPSDADAAAGKNGLLTQAEVTKLTALSPAAFDSAWLKIMIKQQQGSVKLSSQYLDAGENAEIKKFAQQNIDAQQEDINSMKELLSSAG